MKIRKATKKDIPTIVAFGEELMKHHERFDPYYKQSKNVLEVYKKHFTKSIYSKNSLLLIAEDNGTPIGYALGEISTRPPVFHLQKIGYVSDVFVIKKYRKKGIAKQFLDELFRWFKSKKLTYAEITVHVQNALGRKAWERYGFKAYLLRKRIPIK